jgi:hypothetical protein
MGAVGASWPALASRGRGRGAPGIPVARYGFGAMVKTTPRSPFEHR